MGYRGSWIGKPQVRRTELQLGPLPKTHSSSNLTMAVYFRDRVSRRVLVEIFAIMGIPLTQVRRGGGRRSSPCTRCKPKALTPFFLGEGDTHFRVRQEKWLVSIRNCDGERSSPRLGGTCFGGRRELRLSDDLRVSPSDEGDIQCRAEPLGAAARRIRVQPRSIAGGSAPPAAGGHGNPLRRSCR